MSLFVRKDIGALLAEAGAGRCAGSWATGSGHPWNRAVIEQASFVLSGTVASQNAGPALTLSMDSPELPVCSPDLCHSA